MIKDFNAEFCHRMNKLVAIFDNTPLPFFAIAAIFMALAPFQPMPHLVEKFLMLLDGTLTKGIDIFDLFWHALFPVLLVVKIIRVIKLKKSD